MSEIVYIGDYDNYNDFQLKAEDEDGVLQPMDMSSVTEITANIDGNDIVSTNQSNDPIRWNQLGFVTGQIRCKFGPVVSSPSSLKQCYFIVVDPTNPSGVVFDPIILTLVELP